MPSARNQMLQRGGSGVEPIWAPCPTCYLLKIKTLLHKKPVVPSDRVIFKFTEDAEAKSEVKFRCLEGEGVQPDTLATFLTSQRLRHVHQLRSHALPSGDFRHNKQLNE